MNTKRILAVGVEVENNTYRTNLNNNDVCIGPAGAGKTSGYVLPNLLRTEGSCIVADTKGNLRRKTEQILRNKGFKIHNIDFIDLKRSDAYNPLDYIGRNKDGSWSEQDITSLSRALMPELSPDDPFWTLSAQMVLSAMIAYVLEALPEEEHNMFSVVEIFREFATDRSARLFHALHGRNPNSMAYRRYRMLESITQVERTWGCIRQFTAEALELFDIEEAKHIFQGHSSFRFTDLGDEKTVLFLNISDVDRSFDRIVGILYTQLFQSLCRHADNSPGERLRVPVRIIMDDFSTNYVIPQFDNIISVIRSREISTTIILQSLTQLNAMYGVDRANTILNNCDHILYLGGQDLQTAQYIGNRTNRSPYTVLNLPLHQAIVLERGKEACFAEKIPPQYTIDLLKSYEAALSSEFDGLSASA